MHNYFMSYTIRRVKLYVVRKEWKSDTAEVKIIKFVIKLGLKFTTTVYCKCDIKIACQLSDLLAFLTVNWDGYRNFNNLTEKTSPKSNKDVIN